MEEENEINRQEPDGSGTEGVSEPPKKKWFGRGIYGSKDVPIRILDGVIGLMLVAIVALTIIFAINGGYMVDFDTAGGSEIASVKLRHGSYVEEPETPVKAGYEFDGWYYGVDLENKWKFDTNKVGSELTLTAKWVPARVPVKFDLNGGSWKAGEGQEKLVTYGETYGSLPTPQKEGASFAGWIYSGQEITEDTLVTVNGEHVLTAQWK